MMMTMINDEARYHQMTSLFRHRFSVPVLSIPQQQQQLQQQQVATATSASITRTTGNNGVNYQPTVNTLPVARAAHTSHVATTAAAVYSSRYQANRSAVYND